MSEQGLLLGAGSLTGSWGRGVLVAPLPTLQKNKTDPTGSEQLAVTPSCHGLGEKKETVPTMSRSEL